LCAEGVARLTNSADCDVACAAGVDALSVEDEPAEAGADSVGGE
jgi:hypothetical protein